MSDAAAVVLALAAAAGAWWSAPVPLWVPLALVAVALLARRPVLLCLGAALLTSALGARAWAGLRPPPPGPWAGVAQLVTDPDWVSGALRVELRTGRRRVQAWARGRSARELAPRLAGERVAVRGRLSPLAPAARSRLAYRHVAARFTVEGVGDWQEGDPASRLANRVRRVLVSGASSLDPARRALFTGFVLGDDRDQPPEVTADFRAAGLSHLLAVSGANVAFVLALAGPLLRRLQLGWRLAAALTLLVLFGVLTRWEPSVLRAEAMAALALVAATLGRPASGLRLLALAVAGLLVVDPLLVHSVGFLLSVGACAGIVLLARPVAAALPGPRWLASVGGVTLAAQLGVAPVAVPVFGSLPVAALPANLLAVPAAGPVMVWGVVAGLPAGLAGGWLASAAHLPTNLLVWWVEQVARWSAAAPLGELRLPHLVLTAVAVAVAVVAHRRERPGLRRAALFATTLVLAVPAVPVLLPADLEGHQLMGGARLWRRDGATVLVVDGAGPGRRGPPPPADLLGSLYREGVRRLDLVVVARPGPGAARGVGPALARFPPRLLWAPPGHRMAAARVPPAGSRAEVGGLAVEVVEVTPRLQVRVTPR